MQKDLESRLISLIKDEKIFSDILARGITKEDFVLNTEAFEFVTKYYYQYNSVPARSVIESAYPGVEFVEDVKDHEMKYLCDELIKATTKRKAINIINDTSELIMEDTYGAVDSMITKLTGLQKKNQYSKSFADKDALKRYNEVIKNRENISQKVQVGIKTGISYFDNKYIGWQPGNLIGVVGRLGVGKSWIAEYLGCQAYFAGKRVLYLSPEMSVQEVDLRWDTIMGTLNGYTFLNDKLQIGDVNLTEYKKWLTEASQRKDWLTLDSVNGNSFNTANISGLVNEFSPDVVVVDGVSLIEGGEGPVWEKVREVSYGLKAIAQNYKVVIIATSQANRGVGDEMPRPDQVSYGDAFFQSVDIGIMVQADASRPLIRLITIPKVRMGKAMNTPTEIKFDVNRGLLSL